MCDDLTNSCCYLLAEIICLLISCRRVSVVNQLLAERQETASMEVTIMTIICNHVCCLAVSCWRVRYTATVINIYVTN